MRTIEHTTQFKKDYKREAKGQHRTTLAQDFLSIVSALAEDQRLAERHRDHALAGEWKDHRDCHIKPDLVLIYRKPDERRLQLVTYRLTRGAESLIRIGRSETWKIVQRRMEAAS